MTTWINDKALDDIRKVGWHMLGIESDGTMPTSLHTIGLQQTYGHPEIVIVGLKMSTMAGIVSDLGKRIAEGTTLSTSNDLDDVLERYPVRFEEVLPVAHERFLPGAHEFYGKSGFNALQCLWPDKEGRFPDDLSFAGACATVEPRLGDPEWTPIYSSWRFTDSYVLACITTRYVIDRSKPILLVTHDADDGAWQFLCGTTITPEEGKVIALQSAVKIDPTVAELADLPLGWQARRERPGAAWEREPNAGAEDDGE